MFRGNLGHCSRNTINSVTVSQHDWEELYCGMCLWRQCLHICVPTNAIVWKKVCVCILQLIWGKGLQDYSCLLAVGSSWAMLHIGHSHEPLLFTGHGGRQHWGQGSVSTLAEPYTAKCPSNHERKISAYHLHHNHPCMSLTNTDNMQTYNKILRLPIFIPFSIFGLSVAWAHDSAPGLILVTTPGNYQQVFLDVRSARLLLQRARLGREGWALLFRNKPEKKTHVMIRAKNPKHVMDFTSLSWFCSHPLKQNTFTVKETAQIIMLPLP